MKKIIDLKSDTVTKPSPEMLRAMISAEVGDDVYGEDPTVIELESYLAAEVGMEAALFACSGTQSNLLALMSHCERGDEYIAGQQAHLYRWEGGGAAVLGSIQPQPIEFKNDGTLDLAQVEKYIKPLNDHHARTKLLCLEDTHMGKVLPLSYLEEARKFSNAHRLNLHLDGARVYNAVVKLGVSIRDISQHFDSISICLSKGLGAPVGSVLCGSKDFILRARRWRKVLGGGMRQSGVLAAAGLYALKNNIERLEQDHENATFLAKELSQIDGFKIDQSQVQTNMVFVDLEGYDRNWVAKELRARGISLLSSMRLVTHLDVTPEDVRYVVESFKKVARQGKGLKLEKHNLSLGVEDTYSMFA